MTVVTKTLRTPPSVVITMHRNRAWCRDVDAHRGRLLAAIEIFAVGMQQTPLSGITQEGNTRDHVEKHHPTRSHLRTARCLPAKAAPIDDAEQALQARQFEAAITHLEKSEAR